ncbi:uncharacterized protein F4822DRAFT_445392 [Hypoxylon trugodes]|uniref:uncharacterized protein n=1 Tax=Hypoxylon trugodes TaxID=326681 RepID=UPI00219D58DE|nr:uncharacterized protein F4822DRAFT_445392 [Hypoxylon trugodes]KAI1385440.1 hypothetical protein F4822DRAFT_445392 [Hypoxylon trugodes]
MGDYVQGTDDINLDTFEVTREHWHTSQKGDQLPDPEQFGIDLTTPPNRWQDWIVKLVFEKLGIEKEGSGFYINIPNAKFDVILTAGHNLVDRRRHHSSNIRIIHDPHTKEDIHVTPQMIHVCDRYFDDPDEDQAIYDYAVILLARDRKARHRGFGFNLMLGLTPPPGDTPVPVDEEESDILLGSSVYVSGYVPDNSPPKKHPSRSEGKCIRTYTQQLHYKAKTEPGMSGGPVWIGFRGVETVVAIHNYGAENESQGNKGSRLNLSILRTIFGWVNVGWYDKALYYRAPRPYTMHLHVARAHPLDNDTANDGRVRVGKPGMVETRFDILPVAANPTIAELNASYGFILRSTNPSPGPATLDWVRWDPKKNRISPVKRFDALCEVMIPQLIIQPNKPFTIKVRNGNDMKQVQMKMERLDEADLEQLDDSPHNYEDTWEISFVPINAAKVRCISPL